MARPGDQCISPISGKVVRVGLAYANSDLGSIHIQGTGDYWPYHVKILYASPRPGLMGDVVRPGEVIGSVQNVAAYHAGDHPEVGPMRNHLHLELTVQADPERYMVAVQQEDAK